MSVSSALKSLYFEYLSKPAPDRVLLRQIRKLPCLRIVEIGVGRGARAAERLIRYAVRHSNGAAVRYTGVDLFEGRENPAEGMTLKLAHRRLSALGAKVQLVPGDPYSALARTANGLSDTDMLIISADQVGATLERAWFYVPRMLHIRTLVYQQQPSSEKQEGTYAAIPVSEIESRADQQTRLRRAA